MKEHPNGFEFSPREIDLAIQGMSAAYGAEAEQAEQLLREYASKMKSEDVFIFLTNELEATKHRQATNSPHDLKKLEEALSYIITSGGFSAIASKAGSLGKAHRDSTKKVPGSAKKPDLDRI